MSQLMRVAITLVFALMQAGTAFSQQKPFLESKAVDASPASPAERAALLEQFVSKWGLYARDMYHTDLSTWPRQLSPLFESGDATNLRQAATRETFEAAVATLKGQGHRVTDAAVKNGADLSVGGIDTTSGIALMLGALSNDLVYTPIQPCRILDTRSTGAGAVRRRVARAQRRPRGLIRARAGVSSV